MTSEQFRNFIAHLRTLPREEVARIRDSAPQFPQYKEAGELVIAEIDAAKSEKDSERRHREIIRVAWVSAWIAVFAALAAIASAWYAKKQADAAALSAKENIMSTTMMPVIPLKTPK